MADKPFVLSEATSRLVRYLQAMEKDTIITYPQLTAAAGMKITSRSAKLMSARKILERDHLQVWLPIRPHVGIRRLNNEELANRLNKWWLSGARSKLNRGGDQAELVDIQMLTIDQQAAFSIDCIQRALGSDALSKKQRKKMENVARGSSNDFPTYNVVEWAISLMPGRKKGDKDKKDEE